ncbi:MAG: hypothetical protein NXI31_10860 [bacterium]|nr:hypothetical protein [bacterium]
MGYLLVGDLLFWPFDAILSLHWGFAAMLDRDLAIRGGPFGLLAAMVLPCCTAHGGEQGRRLVRGKSRLANPSILAVSEQDLDDYLAGALALEDLSVRGLGAAYRAVVRRAHGVGFAAAEDVLVRVRDGEIAVTRAGGVVARSP